MGNMIKLRPIRNRLGISVYELANTVQMSWAAIDNLEKGRTKPSFATLKKLADALAIAFTLQGKPTSPADVLTELTGISTEIPVLQEAA